MPSENVTDHPPPAPHDDSGEYRFDFGKYKGKTLTHIWRTQKQYLPYLINQGGFLDSKIRLKRAMEDAGIMEDALQEAHALKKAKAEQIVCEAQVGKHADLHPEVAKLKNLQLQEARATLNQSQVDAPPAPIVNRRRARRKNKKETPRVEGPTILETLLGLRQRRS